MMNEQFSEFLLLNDVNNWPLNEKDIIRYFKLQQELSDMQKAVRKATD